MQTRHSRRTFLVQSLAGIGLYTLAPRLALCAPDLLITNVTGLYSVKVAAVAVPVTTAQVAHEIARWSGKVAIGGGRYSMGGQIAIKGGLHIDMREMNRLVFLDVPARVARVQAGMRWRELQDILDPLGLAVKTMQSFSNFSVGGAVSVNAHGRYVGNGPVGNSVRALQLVLPDSSVVRASRVENPTLFSAAIGGYGAVGVITEVELDLDENCRIERRVEAVTLADYPRYFKELVEGRPDCIFHNADLLPPLFNTPVAVTWHKTDKPLTESAKLVKRGETYGLNQNVIFVLTELPGGKLLRKAVIHPLLLAKPAVKWRNHEASPDVAELEPRTKIMSTYVLQEYFVPVANFGQFVEEMVAVIHKHGANVLNVSIRHSPADPLALLPWAKEDVFSFVVYYKQRTYDSALNRVGEWTRDMVEAALKFNGRFYLPYQLHATQMQFDRAYPEAVTLRALKRKIDPANKFSNALWDRYL